MKLGKRWPESGTVELSAGRLRSSAAHPSQLRPPWVFLLLADPCKALGCRPRERCKLEDGQAKCVPSLVASCWAWGDPHYRTFDKRDFDFEGTCTYTMARFCGNDPTLVPFKVEGKNQIRNGVKSISYVSLTNVEVYGHRISIHWREVGKVRVSWAEFGSKVAKIWAEMGRVWV